MRNLGFVGLAVAALIAIAATLWFVLLDRGEDFAVAGLERAITEAGGSFASIEVDASLGEVVITDLSLPDIQFDGGAEQLDLLEIERLSARGVARRSFAELVRLNSEQHLFDQVILEGVTLVEAGQRISIRRVQVSDARIVPSATRSPMGDTVTREQETAYNALLVHLGEVEISGFASPREGITGAEMELATLTGYAGGRFESFDASGLRLWDNGQTGTVGDSILLQIGALRLADVDMTRALNRVVAGQALTFERQSEIPTFAELSAEVIEAEDELGTAIQIARMSFTNSAYVGALATESSVTVNELHFPLDTDAVESAQINTLRRLGYDDLIIDFNYHSQFDMATGVANLDRMQAAVRDMGELSLDLSLHDVPFTEDMVEMTGATLAESGFIDQMLAEATFASGTIRFQDMGIVDRLIDFQALQEDKAPEDVRAEIQAQLLASRAEMAASPLALEAMDALLAFVESPGSITVAANPTEPVPVSQVLVAAQINPALLLEILNLRVSAQD